MSQTEDTFVLGDPKGQQMHLETLWATDLENAMSFGTPMTTDQLIKAARDRHINISSDDLRALWRSRALSPLVEVRKTAFCNGAETSDYDEDECLSDRLQFARARNEGRLANALLAGYRGQIRWENGPTHWNGLLYSPWQILDLAQMNKAIDEVRRNPARRYSEDGIESRHRVSALLVAIEYRFFPEAHPTRRWFHGLDKTIERWETYRKEFDAQAVLAASAFTREEVINIAYTWTRFAEKVRPWTDDWEDLIRHAPHEKRNCFRGAALVWYDAMRAAEMLARFEEELSGKKLVPSSGTQGSTGIRDYVASRRLTRAAVSLDRALSRLGVSPTPGCIVVLEGETEELLFPRVCQALGFSDQFAQVRQVVLRGIKGNVTQIVATQITPRIDHEEADYYELSSPPTCLLAALDPEGPYQTEELRAERRQRWLEEMQAGLLAQGASDVDESVLDNYIVIRVWENGSFEFSHFTDRELAEAISKLDRRPSPATIEELEAALGKARYHSQNIEQVYTNWRPEPSKPGLADLLWPVLRRKIEAAETDVELPEIAQVAVQAYTELGARFAGVWHLPKSLED